MSIRGRSRLSCRGLEIPWCCAFMRLMRLRWAFPLLARGERKAHRRCLLILQADIRAPRIWGSGEPEELMKFRGAPPQCCFARPSAISAAAAARRGPISPSRKSRLACSGGPPQLMANMVPSRAGSGPRRRRHRFANRRRSHRSRTLELLEGAFEAGFDLRPIFGSRSRRRRSSTICARKGSPRTDRPGRSMSCRSAVSRRARSALAWRSDDGPSRYRGCRAGRACRARREAREIRELLQDRLGDEPEGHADQERMAQRHDAGAERIAPGARPVGEIAEGGRASGSSARRWISASRSASASSVLPSELSPG